jgi:hypothetical protein
MMQLQTPHLPRPPLFGVRAGGPSVLAVRAAHGANSVGHSQKSGEARLGKYLGQSAGYYLGNAADGEGRGGEGNEMPVEIDEPKKKMERNCSAGQG